MTTTKRAPRAGYREHDGATEWQECDTCGLRTGANITTAYDAVYYAGDPDKCPRCAAGRMCLPVSAVAESVISQAIKDSIREDRIVTLTAGDAAEYKAICDELLCKCNDSVETEYEYEFWGANTRGDWRVHVKSAK